MWTVLAPILDGTVSIVRNDVRGVYGDRRHDGGGHDYYAGGGNGYYGGDSYGDNSLDTGAIEQYYGTNFEEYGPGVGHYSTTGSGGASSAEGAASATTTTTTTGWEFAARGFEDGLTRLFDGAVNR